MRKVPSKIWIFVATALPVMMCSLAALVLRGNTAMEEEASKDRKQWDELPVLIQNV